MVVGKENSRKTQVFSVRVSDEDAFLIKEKAKGFGMTISQVMRLTVLDKPIKSVIDQTAILKLSYLNADLGRLGGLLKLWLTKDEFPKDRFKINSLLARIEGTQSEIRKKVRDL